MTRKVKRNPAKALSTASKAVRMESTQAYAAVFLASFCMLVVEIVAGRMLAPYVGVSLYTWTSIIGVVLAGISLGAYLGGLFADRFPRVSTLGWILFLSGIGILSIPPLTHWTGGTFLSPDLMMRTVLVTAILFFIPSFLLGMVSPVVVKLSLLNLKKTGNVVGKIYAFSTFGSILGTFATGFFLISWMGTRHLLFSMAILLFLAAPLLGDFFVRRRRIVLFLVMVGFLWPLYRYAFNPDFDEETLFFKESNYYTIRLKGKPHKGHEPLITLYLDQLTHSCSDLEDPFHLVYRYLRSFRELFEWRAGNRESFHALFIGGGGYTFPRFLEAKFPASEIDVVEIDPAVTQVSRKYLGISPSSRIQTFNEDGRWFVMNRPGEGKYDFIFKDVFNDMSIPYHLTTREFAVQLKGLLKRDGILITNVIDRWEKGAFLPSYIRTLEEVFGKGNVALINLGSSQVSPVVENRVVVTSPRRLDMEDLVGTLKRIGETERISYVMPQEQLQGHLSQFQPVILTDDYAPVDNLTAPNFN